MEDVVITEKMAKKQAKKITEKGAAWPISMVQTGKQIVRSLGTG